MHQRSASSSVFQERQSSSDKNIVLARKGNTPEVFDTADDDDESNEEPVTLQSAKESLEKLHRFSMQEGNEESA